MEGLVFFFLLEATRGHECIIIVTGFNLLPFYFNRFVFSNFGTFIK